MVPPCGINSVVNAAKSIFGEMAEWSNAAVSKTVVRQSVDRGFESPSLRKAKLLPQLAAGFLFSSWTSYVHINEDRRKIKRPDEYNESGVFWLCKDLPQGSPKAIPVHVLTPNPSLLRKEGLIQWLNKIFTIRILALQGATSGDHYRTERGPNPLVPAPNPLKGALIWFALALQASPSNRMLFRVL